MGLENENLEIESNNTEKENATEKALRILECFIPYNNELGNAEITKMTGYHRATTSRTIKILERNGYLHQNASTKKYKLGAKIQELYNALAASLETDLREEIRPIMLALRNKTGESVVMEIIDDLSVIPILAFRGNGPLFVDIPVGMPVYWNTSSGLISMLAFADDELKDKFLSQPMYKVTDTSITDLDTYKKRLDETRKRGYAITVDEPVVGIVNYSIPIFDFSGTVIAALNIAGPKARILSREEELVPELRKTGSEISKLFRSKKYRQQKLI
jgi:IclR family KDG regulon transcriptional repressor